MTTRRRALVSQTRVPEIDRDSGSQQVDRYIQWLLADGWSVTFMAAEADAEERHLRRLRQRGVATFTSFDEAAEVIEAGEFDLAVVAFWGPATQLMPTLRELSPDTRVIIDSVDLHFLRDARRMLAVGTPLDDRYGRAVVGEFNAYQAADAVLTVSPKEAGLLAEFLGAERIYELPVAEEANRSAIPFADRRGMFFVGNFRHLPNAEAVEYLCRDILPRLDPELLAEHPLSVFGSRLDEKVSIHGRGLPGVRMVGWVPQIRPYLESARVSVVPLLHGAGVKRKVIDSMMAGTPVVTTTIGAEGLGVEHGEHAVVADTASDLAAGIAHLLTNEREWGRLSDSAFGLVSATHAPERVGDRFLEIVEEVLALPPREAEVVSGLQRRRREELSYRETVAAAGRTLAEITDPGSTVLVVSRGDEALTEIDHREGAHFPQAPNGKWAGYHPVDSDSAIHHLESLRDRGARYLALPSTAFWWLHHYRKLTAHLEARYRRIHSGEHLVVFDLAGEEASPALPRCESSEPARVQVIGSYEGERAAPPPSLVAELDRSRYHTVSHSWGPRRGGQRRRETAEANEEADWTLYVDDLAVLPVGFLDDFLSAAERLAPLGINRVQPAHTSGPDAGPPVTERVRGVFAREVEGPTPLPLLAVRQGAPATGPVAILDAVPLTLARPIGEDADALTFSNVLDVFIGSDDGPGRGVNRSQGAPAPLLSVLIATYERPDLLARCLEGFCEQTLPAPNFEVVVIDDGSSGAETGGVLQDYAARLPLRWVRIEHAGRSAAKNLAVLLARGDVVLFFDDDDLAAPDMLAEHLRAHELEREEGVAVLGHTDWAPGLEITPLMHYLTDVDKMLFAYGHLSAGERYDWRCFWEGRVSSKRSLHLRHGLHDQRLEYSIDVEMAWRLARHGLEVIYQPEARSYTARPIDFDDFCRRYEAKGRAQAAIANLHPDPEMAEYLRLRDAVERWEQVRPRLPALIDRIHQLEATVERNGTSSDGAALDELHRSYREAFFAYNAKGIVEGPNGGGRPVRGPGDDNGRRVSVVERAAGPTPTLDDDAGDDGRFAPALTVTMPVWSHTEALAEMVEQTIARVWEVARLETEVVVVDNCSPFQRPLPASRIHRFDENRGVAIAWNTGIGLARAPVVAVLNSDCRVEPGWDEALYEAVTTGRRIGFPYTDHCDGRGFRQPDQAGTAGWCFMLTLATYREIGPFDELFSPAYCEDTDYWHRAWELGIELSPVPDAHVTHARRTSAGDAGRAEWLLKAHRYLYGWKHGVEPMAAPPYYNREIVEYHCAQSPVSGASTT